jgi:uncharacterized protein YjiS (DUF1127 family)
MLTIFALQYAHTHFNKRIKIMSTPTNIGSAAAPNLLATSSAAQGGLSASVVRGARSAVRSILAYRARKVAEAQLRALDDRMLKDIGLDRSEIPSALTDVSAERRNGVRALDMPMY